MKAILLCGGEGTRLRPLSSRVPKPMVQLFDRPILWHTLRWLSLHGVTEAALTLRCKPHVIREYFSDAAASPIPLRFFTEAEPLGTAGAVRACRDFLSGDEEVIVASGDGICDLDLSAALRFHRERGAEATMLLYSHPEPLSYGIVRTDVRDRVTGFAEKPGWGEVFTDRINTGIYILSPAAIDRIPPGVFYDFSADLFPAMLANDAPLCALCLPGYWRDLGNPAELLACAADCLAGKIELSRGREAAELPEGVEIEGPVYISAGAKLLPPCHVGPGTLLQEGAYLSPGSRAAGSLISGTLGAGAAAEGAILDRGAVLGPSARAERGCVIGCGARIGAGAEIAQGVHIYPEATVEPGCRVTESLPEGGRRMPRPVAHGFSGIAGSELDAEFFLRLGKALGKPGDRVLLAGEPAWTLPAMAAGASAAGISARIADCPFPAVTAMCSRLYGAGLAVDVRPEGELLRLRIYGSEGLPLSDGEISRLTARLSAGSLPLCGEGCPPPEEISGTEGLYLALAARAFPLRGVRLFAGEGTPLRRALELAGAKITPDAPHASLSPDGFSFTLRDETGAELDCAHARAALISAHLLGGQHSRLAVPEDAPAVLDGLAARAKVPLFRAGRDAEAAPLLARHPEFSHGIHGILCLFGILSRRGIRLSHLAGRLPDFHTHSTEIPVPEGRAAAMRHISEQIAPQNMRLQDDRGSVSLRPAADREAIALSAEAKNAEFAAEMCAEIEKLLRDRQTLA